MSSFFSIVRLTNPPIVLKIHSTSIYAFDIFEIYDYRIRAIYGIDGRMNAIHGSDNPTLAEKEIKFFFPTGILDYHFLSQISWLKFFCHQIFKLNQSFKYNQALLFCFSYLSTIVLFSTSYFIVVILEPYPSSTEAIEYFKLNLQPILLKGLTAMAKLKPASDTINAVVSSPFAYLENLFLNLFNFLCTKLLERPWQISIPSCAI